MTNFKIEINFPIRINEFYSTRLQNLSINRFVEQERRDNMNFTRRAWQYRTLSVHPVSKSEFES